MNPRHFDAHAFLDALKQGGRAAECSTLKLLNHYRPFLRALLFARGVAANEVEDLSSEILFKVVTGAHKLRSGAAFHSWLTMIAQHQLATHWKQLARERATFAPAQTAGLGHDDDLSQTLSLLERMPDEGASDPTLRLCLQGQLARFQRDSAERHACIELIALGHDAREIADLIGRNYGATRQFMSECCAALLKLLRPCLSDDFSGARGGAGMAKGVAHE